MNLTVCDIVGMPSVPGTNRGVRDWLKRLEAPLAEAGNRFIFTLSDLPPEVRRSVIERDISAAGLPLGTYDEEAHRAFFDATPKMRDAAERKAAIARDLMTIGTHLTWSERISILRGRHGDEGTSKPSSMRISKAVEGVDPINFAPALLADYSRDGAPKAGLSDTAWTLFLTIIRDAGEGFKIKSAWRDVRDLSVQFSWQWPDFVTVWRGWNALPDAQKLHARIGHSEAVIIDTWTYGAPDTQQDLCPGNRARGPATCAG